MKAYQAQALTIAHDRLTARLLGLLVIIMVVIVLLLTGSGGAV